MSARRPRRGAVKGIPSDLIRAKGIPSSLIGPQRAPRRIDVRPHRSGEWRPDTPFARDVGLQVTMRAWQGLTDPRVLHTPFRFQVPPMGDLERAWEFDWSRYNTLRLGERARPMGGKLMDFSLDSIFVDGANQDDGTSYVIWEGAPYPQQLLDELRVIAGKYPGADPTPFRLTVAQPSVWGGRPLLNECMVLTGVRAAQKADEVGTEHISLAFLEYERTDVDRHRRPRPSDRTQKHTLRRSDDLYEIAKRYYRAPSLWRVIAKKNGIAGVSPGSEAELAKWAKKHHRTKLTIPPKPGR